jgi:hypothetical protein
MPEKLVGLMIFEDKGRILLRRRELREAFPREWSLLKIKLTPPIDGKPYIDQVEDEVSAAAEKLLMVSNIWIKDVTTMTYPDVNKFVLRGVTSCSGDVRDLIQHPELYRDLQWFRAEDLKRIKLRPEVPSALAYMQARGSLGGFRL